MILVCGNTKGGVGKTTLALNIAIARALVGRDVWLVDGDRQGTAEIALAIRAENNKAPIIACSKYEEGSTLRPQVLHQLKKYDDIIIDAGGRDSSSLRAALTLADVLLIPFAPRSFDTWALADVNKLVDIARETNANLKAYVMLNCADAGGKDNSEAAAEVADYPSLNYIDAPIRRRKAIPNAAGNGMSVLEYSPRDLKACDELTNLVDKLFTIEGI